jgi:putative protease
MSKLGDTIFELKTLEVKLKKDYFIPISVLNEMRRRVANELTKIRSTAYIPERIAREIKDIDFKSGNLTYTENIANDNALKLYESLGAGNIEPAFELTDDHKGKVVMTTKHCIRYQLNACNIYQKNQVILDDPLYLKDNNHLYKLHFDCKKCEMQLIFEK